MHAKLLTVALLASAVAMPAFAQTDRPATNPPAAAQTAPKAQSSMWRSSKLIGLDVYNEQNEKIGDISEILLDKSGKVEGVVIGVGGFLGIGQRDIKVEMSKLKFVDEPVRSSAADRPAGDRPATTGTGDRPAPRATTARSDDRKWYPDHAVLIGAGNKDQVKNMPEFKYE
jgi:sporulation protein YlmC with PRC-barrel domain